MNDSIYPLVEYAAAMRDEDIPDQVIRKTEDLFQDTIGCILSGSSATGMKELKEITDLWGGAGHATVLPFGERTSAPSAAFLNAAMAHANDYDDTHDSAVNHGCVTLVPALLATCEALSEDEGRSFSGAIPFRRISGREIISALAIGLDISNRMGLAFIPYLHVGWLPTTLWGPFACAAACGRLLRLDTERMYNAFGLAYSQIHANRQGLLDGVLTKRIQPAFSASAGVNSAFFAADNITGARNIVDGDFGIRALYTSGRIDKGHIRDGLGTFFETVNVSIKPYPCCRCTHPVIDAALTLKKEHSIDWNNISRGIIYLPPQAMGQIGNEFEIRDNPTVDAQFSAQYTAALSFIRGWPVIDDFEKENVISREDIKTLAKRFSTVEFEKNQSGLVPVEMDLILKDGRNFHARIPAAKGSRENPLTKDELVLKFNNCLDNSAKKYPRDAREKILKGMEEFVNFEDMREFMRLF